MENVEEKDSQFAFKGMWLPDADPARIGPENFQKLSNMRYVDGGIEGVNGYSKVTTDVLATYTNIRKAIQLTTDRDTKSYIFAQAKDVAGQGRVYVFKTTPPSQGTWEATHIHEDASSGLDAQMHIAPKGHVFYCNGEESMVYAGDEMRVGAFITVTETEGSELITNINDREFTAANNWANVDINTYSDGAGFLSITANASGQYCTLGTTHAPMTAGVLYRISFYVSPVITSGWIIKDAGNNDVIATITTSGTHTVDYIPTVTGGGFRVESNAADSSAAFDNYTLKEVTFSEPIEHTEKINNTLQTSNEIVSIGTQKNWFVFTTRPLKRTRYLIKTANDTTSTLTAKYYRGTGWTDVSNMVDGTTSGGIALAQDGYVSFDDTESDAIPFHYQGLYLYAYYFTLSAGTAEIYHVSVDAAWQSMKDVWDGVYRQPIQAQVEKSTKWSDYTLQVNEFSTIDAPFGMVLNSITTTDEIIIMSEERLAAIQFTMHGEKVSTTSIVSTLKTWSGTAFVAANNFSDGTSDGGKTFGQTGAMTWTPPEIGDEPSHYLFSTPGYAYQITLSGALSADVMVDVITCIPAQLTMKPFKLSGTYKNRVMLGGYTAGKEGNRMDYGVTNAPDAFNGYESSMDGIQSLYYGGSTALSCATEIYNRFGANIFTLYLVLKATEAYVLSGDGPEDFKIFPVSYTIGCPASDTLCNAETGFEMAENVFRNVAMWISYSGPMMFDGAVIKHIDGINSYFDPESAVHINFDAINISSARYDSLRKEWNVMIPTGTNTENDTWLVFDMKRNRWFKKDPSPQHLPQMLVNVQNEAGTMYLYGGIDSGRLMHIENGYNWDGNEIVQEVHSGDFWPDENIWNLSEGRYLKLAAKRMTEDVEVEVIHYKNSEVEGGVGVTWKADDVSFVDVTAALTVSGLAGVAWAAPTLSALNFDLTLGTERIVRDTGALNNIQGWCFSFKFKVATSNTPGGFKPLFWGLKSRYMRDDDQPQQ